MKAKLLRDAGEMTEGTEVEIVSGAGTNDDRSDEDVGGPSETVAPLTQSPTLAKTRPASSDR